MQQKRLTHTVHHATAVRISAFGLSSATSPNYVMCPCLTSEIVGRAIVEPVARSG